MYIEYTSRISFLRTEAKVVEKVIAVFRVKWKFDDQDKSVWLRLLWEQI